MNRVALHLEPFFITFMKEIFTIKKIFAFHKSENFLLQGHGKVNYNRKIARSIKV